MREHSQQRTPIRPRPSVGEGRPGPGPGVARGSSVVRGALADRGAEEHARREADMTPWILRECDHAWVGWGGKQRCRKCGVTQQ
ncbi:hypothetical protein CRV15_02875 [Streptomyces clavuligerus]|nr:hypothetical protein D1794_03445 [Streptomyces clavuligerus]QCS04637.1 hypothetical protein CRV15_02875 [Streptomyces clavuligerus]